MIATRRGSPLALGFGEEENFVSSDATSLSLFSKRICYLEEDDFAVLTPEDVKIFDGSGNSVGIPDGSGGVTLTKDEYDADGE